MIVFEKPDAIPIVSIIIPMHNRIDLTLVCLESIRMNTAATNFEIIVVDDGSDKHTRDCLAMITGARIISNDTNVGFLHSCNVAAAKARGAYLLFLNNDTEVTPGWLDALLRVFSLRPDAGIVGAKLLYPDGRLQEAGATMCRQASSIRYGNLQDSSHPQFNFLRETNYCSGACLLIPKKLFDVLGGFDPLFAPGYYEDVDLAFRTREIGRKVYYQPFSVVIHYEGGSRQPSALEGIGRNQNAFRIKWRNALLQCPELDARIAAIPRDESAQPRALVISGSSPFREGVVFDDPVLACNTFRELGFRATFVSMDLTRQHPQLGLIQESGVECLYKPYVSDPFEFILTRGIGFSLIVLISFRPSDPMIAFCHDFAPEKTLVLNPAY